MARPATIRTPLGRELARVGVTLVDLAAATGIGYTHLWRVTSGERPLSERNRYRCAKALGVPPESLTAT